MSDLPNHQGTQEQEAPYPDTKFTKFFGRLYAAVFALFAITALSVFVLPENILDASAACADFVKFMKQFFPNIAAIGKISPHTQLAEFYVAALWISLAGFFVMSSGVFSGLSFSLISPALASTSSARLSFVGSFEIATVSPSFSSLISFIFLE